MCSLYDEDGYVVPVNSITQASLTTPRCLVWDLPPSLAQTVDRALTFCRNVSSLFRISSFYILNLSI